MRNIIALFLIALLSGCGTSADPLRERALRTGLAIGTLGLSEHARQEGLAQEICTDAGLKEGTPEYTKCFLDIKKTQLGRPVISNRNSVEVKN